MTFLQVVILFYEPISAQQFCTQTSFFKTRFYFIVLPVGALTQCRFFVIILSEKYPKLKGGGSIKNFCFTVDDNIRFLKEITENHYQSIFDHPYIAVYKRLHEEFDLKIQLNLFYQMENFDLSLMSDAYYNEWKDNSDWLKLSFHSAMENDVEEVHFG